MARPHTALPVDSRSRLGDGRRGNREAPQGRDRAGRVSRKKKERSLNDIAQDVLRFPLGSHASEATREATIHALLVSGLPIIALKPRTKEPRYSNWQNEPRLPVLPGDNVGIRHDHTA